MMNRQRWYALGTSLMCSLLAVQAGAEAQIGADKSGQLDKALPLIQRFQVKRLPEARSLTMLILSGGGSYGPWGTGVLTGWHDGRPDRFDIVTGVSTGAMIAPFAYLPQYLHNNVFPDYVKHAKHIHRKRFPLFLPFTNSLYSLKPLSRLIARFMKPKEEDKYGYDLFRLVAETYDEEGRLLLIGTVSMRSGAFCAWNLGEIAFRGQDGAPGGTKMYKKMFHDVLLASAAMPAYHSPVDIHFEEVHDPEAVVSNPDECGGGKHIDGGTRRQAFVSLSGDLRRDWAMFDAGTFKAFVIVNQKLVPPRKCDDKNSLIVNGKRGLEILLNEQLIGNLHRLRSELLCLDANPGNECKPVDEFRLSYIPHDEPFNYPIDKFPRKKMADLHKKGVEWGEAPTCYDADPSARQRGWCRQMPTKETRDDGCPAE